MASTCTNESFVPLEGWAKWLPYSVKLPAVAGSGSLGSSIVTGGAAVPPAVSLSAGLAFARTYFLAIWPALVAGLVLAAAVQTVLPRDWVARLVGRGRGAVAGGAVPTGAEVAVVAALLAAGVAPALAATLLITLPAVSLPSLLMVRRVFPAGLLARVTVVVVATGLASAAVAVLAGG